MLGRTCLRAIMFYQQKEQIFEYLHIRITDLVLHQKKRGKKNKTKNKHKNIIYKEYEVFYKY